jgi:hypothetical protein
MPAISDCQISLIGYELRLLAGNIRLAKPNWKAGSVALPSRYDKGRKANRLHN